MSGEKEKLRLDRITHEAMTLPTISQDDALFLVKEIGMRQQALDLALAGVKSGRLFGLEEAAEMMASIGRRITIAKGLEAGMNLHIAAQNIKAYARELRAREEAGSGKA